MLRVNFYLDSVSSRTRKRVQVPGDEGLPSLTNFTQEQLYLSPAKVYDTDKMVLWTGTKLS